MEEDVDDWMIAGINAMLDKVRVTRGIPFDLSTAICGVLGVSANEKMKENAEEKM